MAKVKNNNSGKVKAVKPKMVAEKYRPSVFIDSAESKRVAKLEPGQKVQLIGKVTRKNVTTGKVPSSSVSIEIHKIKNQKKK